MNLQPCKFILSVETNFMKNQKSKDLMTYLILKPIDIDYFANTTSVQQIVRLYNFALYYVSPVIPVHCSEGSTISKPLYSDNNSVPVTSNHGNRYITLLALV